MESRRFRDHPQHPMIQSLRFSPLVLVLCALSLASARADTSAAIRELTGAPTKIVWLQDTGDKPAVDAERPTLKLMGLDTEDGKGERVILSELARYWKPLISPDGNRVFFGNKEENAVYVVNWDGTGKQRLLENARFDDIWADPKDGTEWLYVTVTEKRGEKDIPVIRRFRTDDLKVSELVWDKMPLHMFILSGDGRAASGGGDGGNSPQGMVTLPNGTFYARAGGCWPSITPDSSHRMWVFTGNHRSVHMFFPTNRSGNAYGETVKFDASPGLTLKGGEEVHRIRWSNNVRFFTVASPFAQWSYKSDVKIPKPVADKIEIYIGKFSEDLKTVEKWVAVTANESGDYWSDVWVKPSKEESAAVAVAPELPEESVVEKVDNQGLVFVWETGAQGNQIDDPKTGAIRQCTGQFRGEGKFALHHVMDLTGGAFVPEGADAPLLEACKASNQFAVEAIVTPLGEPTPAEKVIIAFGDDLTNGNFALTQQGEWLNLRVKTEGSSDAAIPIARLISSQPNYVIVSYSPGKLAAFVNGKRAIIANPLTGSLANWTPQHLIFGDAWNGGHNWPGTLEGIGIYSREIGEGEARQRFVRQSEARKSRKPAEKIVVDAKLIGRCPAADPQGIAPYRRCFSVQLYEVTKVIEGKLDDPKITVAQWSVLDGKVVPAYEKMAQGQTYRLTLEPWEAHPEQESERSISGDFEADDLALFYDVTRNAVAAPAAEVAPWRGFTGTIRLVGSGSVAAITVLVGGEGYSEAPKVILTGESKTPATAEAVMKVSEIRLARLGSGYTSAPTVQISEPDVAGGRPAQAIGKLDATNGTVTGLSVRDSGSGYLRAPTLTIHGGGGTGAEAEATLSVSEVVVTNGGAGYSQPPAVTFVGDGEKATAQAALHLTALRYSDGADPAFFTNDGNLEQEGSTVRFDWAATAGSKGPRGLTNSGSWILRHGSMVHFSSPPGRSSWFGRDQINTGTLRLLEGSRMGLANFENSGVVELGAGTVLGQVEQAGSENTFRNVGDVKVLGSSIEQPATFGTAGPGSNGNRLFENGGSAPAKLAVGNGSDASSFSVLGGQVELFNHLGSTVTVESGATLALMTNDNGSQNRFANRNAKLTNFGDLILSGRLLLQGNHRGFTGLENFGRTTFTGNVVIDRLRSSTGPGGLYKPESTSLIINQVGAILAGSGTVTFVNHTGSPEGAFLRIYNFGTLTPGNEKSIGQLKFENANVFIGVVAGEKTPAHGGTLQIGIAGPGKADALIVTGSGSFGKIEIAKGVGSTLNVVTASGVKPTGTFRIVTAGAVTGAFDSLQFNGQNVVPYKINYLPDRIELVF